MNLLKRLIGRRLFAIAKSSFGVALTRGIFAHMSFLLPIHRLHETAHVVAFYHPKPSYHVHVLIVPKKGIASLSTVTAEDGPWLTDVFLTAQVVVNQLGLQDSGYRLITNGGDYQDIQQLHFHLISGQDNQ